MAKRFLIVRLSAIGDTIHSIPLAAALKRLHPDCFLGWVVEKPSAPLIVGNPLVDWVHVLPKGWLKHPGQVFDLWRGLRKKAFDIVFNVQGLSKSAIVARLSGAPRQVGFRRGEGRELAPFFDNVLVKPEGRHAVDMTLSLLAGIGETAPDGAEFAFPACPAAERETIDGLLAEPEYAGGFVRMGPWGSFPAKLWPLARFAKLAAVLMAETGMPSLMLGHGEHERMRVELLLEGDVRSVLAAAPDVSLPGVVELARRAALFVGCDSFPMHAAAAVGCRTLGLFGVTDPARLGPYGPRGAAVFADLTLPKSTRQRRKLGPENMERLGVDQVAKACLDLLGRER